MSTETINLEINGTDFECQCEFEFIAGYPGVYHALPEDCYPEEPDRYEILSLNVVIEDKGTPDGFKEHDVSFLAEDLEENIVEQLKEIRESYYEN